MAFILKDRVLETSDTTGTGSFTLSGAVTGFVTFSSAIGNTNTTYYTIENPNTTEWEVGIGTVSAGSISRDTVLASSTGSKVSFTGGAKNVFCDYPASKAVALDVNGNATINAVDDGYLNTAASGTLITLTVSSVRRYTITGSGGQTIKLPDATTLVNGSVFEFDNNQSSGAITVNNNSNTLIVSVPSGGIVRVNLLSNAIAAGSWDRHDLSPANVSWSTNTLDYAGSITSATWNGNTVAVNRGGTGQSSALVAGSVVYGASTTAMGVTAAGTAGQVLQSNGASAPSWVTSPAAGAGGSNTQIQYNNSGVLAGNSTYTMVSGVMKENGYNFVSQADVGSSPSQIPLNQYLGSMAYEDKAGVVILGGTASLDRVTVTGSTVPTNGVYLPATNSVGIATNSTERMRIDASGNVLIGKTSATANGGDLQVSSGVTFPATQVPKSDANTLDDYEEGTFSPVAVGSTTAGTGTYVAQFGVYTKIGSLVTAQIYVEWTAHTGTGNLRLSGLPFNSAGTYYSAASLGYVTNLTLTALNIATAYMPPSVNYIIISQTPVGGGGQTAVPMDSATGLVCTVTYLAS